MPRSSTRSRRATRWPPRTRCVATSRARSASSARHDMVADCVEAASGRLVDLWLRLGEDGPTGAAAQGRDDRFYRARYLKPLARLFVGALRGSRTHRAVYLDERTRCLSAELDGVGRLEHLARRLGIEAEAFAT